MINQTNVALLSNSIVTPVPSSASSSISEATESNYMEGAKHQDSNSIGMQRSSTMASSPAQGESAQFQLKNQSSIGAPSTPHHPIAEFLYQLTKMLTDDNNEIIEWSQARIKVHFPDRLEQEVLHKYFRHSKFASFQRQLNYFGFRKIAGKGKMSPCSYVNDAATEDIRSLLLIKRKTNGSAARKAIGAAAAANATQAANRNMNVNLNVAAAKKNGLLTATGVPQPLGALQGNPSAEAALSQALQESALRNGLSQQALQQKALGESFYFPSENAFAALAAGQNLQALGSAGFNLAQLNGQLNSASLAAVMPEGAASAAATNLASSISQGNNPGVSMPCPATAAMNAALSSTNNMNMFESSANLSSLVNDRASLGAAAAAAAARQQPAGRVTSQANLLNRLPSSGNFLPDNLSSASLSNLLGANRVSSLLSLNSFLSRDPSLVDLMGAPTQPPFSQVVTTGFEPTPIPDSGHAFSQGARL